MIDVVVVNWNSGSQLKRCVKSVDGKFHTIIVDNASCDSSEQSILDLPNVTLIRQNENQGFGKACNIGARLCRSDFILFLNPDAAIFPDTLDKLLVFMHDTANANVGICGVQLIDEGGHVARHCARFPTTNGFVAHAMGLDRIFPRIGHVMSEWDHATTRQVDQVIGAFFLVRRSLFEALGGFDERFFVYYEEVDFSLRANRAGWKSAYFAGVNAFHAGNGTTRNIKARRLFYSLRSRLLYVFKNFVWYKAFMVFIASVFIEPISRSVLSLVRLSWSGFKETWLAYGMLFRWLPQWGLRGKTR